MPEEIKEHPETTEEDEIYLLDYLIVLAKRKKLILGVTLSVAIVTTIFSLFLPNTYWARTTVLLPQASSGPMWMRMLSEFTGGSVISESGINDPNLFAQLLYSGPVLDKIIDKFKLTEYYENADTRRDLRDQLSSSVSTEFILPENARRGFGPQTSRLLMISVIDKDAAKAAEMANAFVGALQEFLRDIAVNEAAQKRLFLEDQLKKSKNELIEAEDAMREFQEKTGVFKVEQQAGAVLESIANLRAQIAAKEVEQSVMKSYSTPNNPDLQRVSETIKGLTAELAKLEQKDGVNPDPLMPTGRMAAVGTDYVRKLRDLKFNETLYELLTKQYEIARIEEARDPAVVQVLEEAYPSEERAGPERKKKILISSAAAFFFSVFLAFVMEFIEKQKSLNPENRERMERLKGYLSFKRHI